jgi:PAS domain S-box-containing protein
MNLSIEQIKSMNHHFRHAIEQVGEGILIIEARSLHPLGPQIVFANRTAAELTGYPREALIEQPIGLIYEPESLNGLISKLPIVAESGKLVSTEKDVIQRRSGRVRCRWTISAVRDESGAVVNFILTFAPVRPAVEPEEIKATGKLPPSIEESFEKSRVESLALLAAGIAHDFNNVLQTIVTHLSLAKLETPLHSAARQHIDDSLDATQDAQSLARQILDFTKGREPKIEVANLADVLRRSAKLSTMGTQVRCDIVSPEGLWGVEVDARQIRQVIHNLLINACQAMPAGGVIQGFVENLMIPEGSNLDLEAGPYVVVRIRDRGCGIPAARLREIFEPYYTTKENGTGIGLATCRAIVQRHRGTITVTSKVNVGTEFRVFLPACQIFYEEEYTAPTPQPVSGSAPKKAAPRVTGLALPDGVIAGTGRILVVDDQDNVREAAERLLKKLGYDPVSASSGQEAVALYKEYANSDEPIDAVLLDMTLPGGLSGDEVMTEIRKMDRNARVIATSGFFSDDAEVAFRRDGYVGILPKPYAVERLSEKLAEAMQN